MNHTPGPWKAVQRQYWWSIETDTEEITSSPDAERRYGCVEKEENARLMAAAPEMLEALEDIARGAGPYSRDPLTHASNTIEYMVSIAQSAIAKTRGEG